MTDVDKTLLLSLIRAVENLVIEKTALMRFAEMRPIPAHVRDAFVSTARNDPVIVTVTRARFDPIYDQVEHSPDLSKTLQSLLSALQ